MSTSPCTKTQQMTHKQRAITNGNFIQLDTIIFSIFLRQRQKTKNGLKKMFSFYDLLSKKKR